MKSGNPIRVQDWERCHCLSTMALTDGSLRRAFSFHRSPSIRYFNVGQSTVY